MRLKSNLIIKKNSKKNKKRIFSNREKWIDFRIYLYGILRITEMILAMNKAEKEFKKRYKITEKTVIGVNKYPNRKSYAAMFDISDREDKINNFSEVRIENVKTTITKCVALPVYWKKKKFFFKETLEVKDIKKLGRNLLLKEIEEYNRSVTSYVNKEKYDTDFYLNNIYAKEIANSETLKDKKFFKNFELFNETLKFLFINSKHWLWFKGIR